VRTFASNQHGREPNGWQRTLDHRLTPDSDDAFYYFALATGRVPMPEFLPRFRREPISALNQAALDGTSEVTAVSSVIYPEIADYYAILSVGSRVHSTGSLPLAATWSPAVRPWRPWRFMKSISWAPAPRNSGPVSWAGCALEHPAIAEVRGLGLMVGVELRDSDPTSAAARTDAVLEAMKDAGFLLGKTGTGRNVLTWMPPLVVSADDLDEAVSALTQALTLTS
jgi:hypothetical protein